MRPPHRARASTRSIRAGRAIRQDPYARAIRPSRPGRSPASSAARSRSARACSHRPSWVNARARPSRERASSGSSPRARDQASSAASGRPSAIRAQSPQGLATRRDRGAGRGRPVALGQGGPGVAGLQRQGRASARSRASSGSRAKPWGDVGQGAGAVTATMTDPGAGLGRAGRQRRPCHGPTRLGLRLLVPAQGELGSTAQVRRAAIAAGESVVAAPSAAARSRSAAARRSASSTAPRRARGRTRRGTRRVGRGCRPRPARRGPRAGAPAGTGPGRGPGGALGGVGLGLLREAPQELGHGAVGEHLGSPGGAGGRVEQPGQVGLGRSGPPEPERQHGPPAPGVTVAGVLRQEGVVGGSGPPGHPGVGLKLRQVQAGDPGRPGLAALGENPRSRPRSALRKSPSRCRTRPYSRRIGTPWRPSTRSSARSRSRRARPQAPRLDQRRWARLASATGWPAAGAAPPRNR